MSTILRSPPQIIVPGASNGVRVQTPVRAEQWKPMAQAYAWLLGQGTSLASCGPQFTNAGSADVIAAGAGRSLRFYMRPHIQNTTRVWIMHLAKAGGVAHAASAFGTVTFGGSATFNWSLPGSQPYGQPLAFVFADDSFTPSGSEVPLIVDLDVDAASPVGVNYTGIGCYEVPRAQIGEFTDPAGVPATVPDSATCQAQQPIYAQEYPSPGSLSPGQIYSASVRGVMKAQSLAVSADGMHRGTLFSQPIPRFAINSTTTFADVFDVPVWVQHRCCRGEPTISMRWRIEASMSSASAAGEIRLTSQRAGFSSTVTVNPGLNSADFAWYSVSLIVNTEDLSRLDTDGGLRGGVAESVRVEFRRTTGTGSIRIRSVCGYEVSA
jgi:hypothetical protein